jgi:hypothetical protein
VRVIIAGSRSLASLSWLIVRRAVRESGFEVTEVVSGKAKGVDAFGEEWAKQKGVEVAEFYPDWLKGKGAGYMRNVQMAEYADALVAVWDGKSRGTEHMIGEMRKTVAAG